MFVDAGGYEVMRLQNTKYANQKNKLANQNTKCANQKKSSMSTKTQIMPIKTQNMQTEIPIWSCIPKYKFTLLCHEAIFTHISAYNFQALKCRRH